MKPFFKIKLEMLLFFEIDERTGKMTIGREGSELIR